MATYQLTVNGVNKSVDVEADTPLLWVLRDSLDMVGTKYGCGIGECGACTVHLDGKAQRSCQMSIGKLGAAKVTTIEGLAKDGKLTALQQAWCDHDVPQCGYCQGGQLMSATALLAAKPKPTDKEIDAAMSGNICRCATYTRIRGAIHAAAEAK
ncbi:MAG TPA: (2Fe-2S)-binding protein [Opitutales bacterium]|jgi:isoquinoline 1-oxidoreductase alpha subunit|nr:(2Fe-2S)-binding protein [Opitutales bacterium]